MPRRHELRAHREELQRVQVGLVGLAGVLLVVTLANIVIQTARSDPASDIASGTLNQVNGGQLANLPSGGNEPLADLGVTPTADQATIDPPVLPVEQAAPSVPDLEPDPRLSQPMDRDPEGRQQNRR